MRTYIITTNIRITVAVDNDNNLDAIFEADRRIRVGLTKAGFRHTNYDRGNLELLTILRNRKVIE